MATKYLFYAALVVVGMALASPNQPPVASGFTQAEAQPSPIPSLPKYQAGKDSAVYVEMKAGSCSATLFGPTHHVLLAAEHCVKEGPIVKVNDAKVTSHTLSRDGHDHVFVYVDQYVPGRPAQIAPMPAGGTEVYLWGNPMEFRDLLRIGYVSGRYMMDGTEYTAFQINSWHGDSGGALFDANGNVVAIMLGIRYETAEGGWDVAIAQPFAFTPAQIKAANGGFGADAGNRNS